MWGTNNTSYYFYNNQNYWAMSPCYVDSGSGAVMFGVHSNGNFDNNYVDSAYDAWGVRPVINLKADVTITGEGTSSNPYVVVS